MRKVNVLGGFETKGVIGEGISDGARDIGGGGITINPQKIDTDFI